jgi:hypothetical protein
VECAHSARRILGIVEQIHVTFKNDKEFVVAVSAPMQLLACGEALFLYAIEAAEGRQLLGV